MHIYQKHILDLLRHSDELHYAQLQPDGVESSHFKYHLNQLMKDGYVGQSSRGIYALTTDGHAYVDTLSEGTVLAEKNPKVITYTLLEDDKHYYLSTKTKDPYRGLLNMVGGKVHIGESTSDSAKREVLEKTGLVVVDVRLRGIAEVRIYSENVLLSHIVAYIYSSSIVATEQDSGLVAIQKNRLSAQDDCAPDLKSLVAALSDSVYTLNLNLNI
ncbi:NUDIX domain-containing protein [Candidatus Saccharibacteria bacterium]|nr:NUDIX domain-containing protein [Candidatus Saccharibacteria bacterium]